MNKAQTIWDKVKPTFDTYKIKQEVLDQIDPIGGQSARDVRDRDNWGYYQWLGAFCREYKPKQVLELGGAWGASALVMSSELPEDSMIYSITLPEEKAFAYIGDKNYPNIQPIIGNDLSLESYPPGTDLSKTQVFFFDSLHTKDQLSKEIELYKQFFQEDTILFFDDIHLPELYPFWLDLPYSKLDVSILHLPSGFGIAVC